MIRSVIDNYSLGMHNGKDRRVRFPGEYHEAVNITLRDQLACTRPHAEEIVLRFQGTRADQQLFREGNWQGMGVYRYGGEVELHMHVAGSNFRINLRSNEIEKANAPSGPTNPAIRRVFYQAHAGYLIRQDGSSPPLLVSGSTVRNPIGHEVPVGKQMASGAGYLILANPGGTGFNVSDYFNPDNSQYTPAFLNGGIAGDPALTFADQAAYYWGDTQFIPINRAELGCLTGLKFAGLGRERALLVAAYEAGAWIYNLWEPRQNWVSTPIGSQLVGFKGNAGSENLATLNNGADLAFHYDGQGYSYAEVRSATTRGNLADYVLTEPVSGWTDTQYKSLSWSGYQRTFDRMFLSTVFPRRHSIVGDRFTYQQTAAEALLVGEYEHAEDQRERAKPRVIYSSRWEYPNRSILGMESVVVDGEERLYLALLNRDTGENELWLQSGHDGRRMSLGEDKERTGATVPISFSIDFKTDFFGDGSYRNREKMKRIEKFSHWVEVFGTVSFETLLRWDKREKWIRWAEQSWCTAKDWCGETWEDICKAFDEGCCEIRSRFLPHLGTVTAEKAAKESRKCDDGTNEQIGVGHELDMRIEGEGSVCFSGHEIFADDTKQNRVSKAEKKASECAQSEDKTCETLKGES